VRTLAIALLLSVSGCGNLDRHVANLTGSSESCIDGVKYIQFPSGASVKYTKDGRIATC
jgi:hypothetical protein